MSYSSFKSKYITTNFNLCFYKICHNNAPEWDYLHTTYGRSRPKLFLFVYILYTDIMVQLVVSQFLPDHKLYFKIITNFIYVFFVFYFNNSHLFDLFRTRLYSSSTHKIIYVATVSLGQSYKKMAIVG